ncbi:MAG: hypothetical protein QM765_52585 [Myxococcales bacterium]
MLFWGIIGALVMRAVFIFVGVALLSRFHFLFYVFGAFLIYTGGKLLFSGGGEEVEPQKNLAYRLFTRFFRISENIEQGHFFVVEKGHRVPTRLLLVLVVVEATDVLFAVDSIPAVLAVSTDPFVVYTSNIFAILGLRALYFLLASVMAKFRFLNVGLAFVLAFIGLKMILANWLHVPPAILVGGRGRAPGHRRRGVARRGQAREEGERREPSRASRARAGDVPAAEGAARGVEVGDLAAEATFSLSRGRRCW